MSSSFSLAGTDLTTDRLVLRSWSDNDLTAVSSGARLEHWAADYPAEGDRVVAGFLTEHPAARTEYGQRQIIERDSGLVIGGIGLFWPPSEGTIEFGYGIVPTRRGRGYATEATLAIVEFAFTAEGVHAVYADVELSNPPSVRVLERAGLDRWSGNDETARFGRVATVTTRAPDPGR